LVVVNKYQYILFDYPYIRYAALLFGTMKISVIIPIYNEAKTIEVILQKILDTGIVNEIIIVNDCSTDGTIEILKKIDKTTQAEVYSHENNMGKGAAIRTALGYATGDIIIFQDADLEYDPREFVELIKPIKDGVADVVYGSRLLGGKPQRTYMFWHKIGNKFLNFLTNVLYNTTVSDMETGYKVFRREVIKSLKLKSDGFSIEPEITDNIFKKNGRYRVY